jgi:hypothetical protein
MHVGSYACGLPSRLVVPVLDRKKKQYDKYKGDCRPRHLSIPNTYVSLFMSL